MKHCFSFQWILILSALVAGSCSHKYPVEYLVVTESRDQAGTCSDTSWIWNNQSRIVKVRNGKTTVLTEGFYSARAPKISFDAKFMLFAGREKKSSPWQIWEMDLDHMKSRKVIDVAQDCTDPVYLPGERFIFSRKPAKDTLAGGITLYNGKLDGSESMQITFHPHCDLASNILADGRILMLTRSMYPVTGKTMLYVLRPDGTKAGEYITEKGISSGVQESADGMICFINSDTAIISIRRNRPLHSYKNLTPGVNGEFRSVCLDANGGLMACYRHNDGEKFALYRVEPGKAITGKPVFSDSGYHIVEAVAVHVMTRPKKLPSEVDPGVKTGLVMCQDINSFPSQGITIQKAVKIEILGIGTSYGIIDAQKDGSFYLKVMANMPFTIRTLDANGHTVHNTGFWMWVRPNERRGFTGLGPIDELSPINRVPDAVKISPVIVPVHITKIDEKEIELE